MDKRWISKILAGFHCQARFQPSQLNIEDTLQYLLRVKGYLTISKFLHHPDLFFSCTTEMKFLLHPGRLLHFVPLIDTTEHRFEIVCNSSILYVNFQQVFKDSRYSVDPYVKGKAQIFYSNIKLKYLIAICFAPQFRNWKPEFSRILFYPSRLLICYCFCYYQPKGFDQL